MNYEQPAAQGLPLTTILMTILVLLLIYTLVRRILDLYRKKNIRARSQEAGQLNHETRRMNEEHQKYTREQNTMAQEKRDEQIRLLSELVELEKQSVGNQKEIQEILKNR